MRSLRSSTLSSHPIMKARWRPWGAFFMPRASVTHALSSRRIVATRKISARTATLNTTLVRPKSKLHVKVYRNANACNLPTRSTSLLSRSSLKRHSSWLCCQSVECTSLRYKCTVHIITKLGSLGSLGVLFVYFILTHEGTQKANIYPIWEFNAIATYRMLGSDGFSVVTVQCVMTSWRSWQEPVLACRNMCHCVSVVLLLAWLPIACVFSFLLEVVGVYYSSLAYRCRLFFTNFLLLLQPIWERHPREWHPSEPLTWVDLTSAFNLRAELFLGQPCSFSHGWDRHSRINLMGRSRDWTRGSNAM